MTKTNKATSSKTTVKKSNSKKAADSKQSADTKTLSEKLTAVVEANGKKGLAEDKRLLSKYKKQITEAYKKMEGCYLSTAYALHNIYKNQLYKLEGYKNIYDFAKENYNIARGTCSNFINICEKFGLPNENGNITGLAPQYEGYGVSQLAVMLTFPAPLLDMCKKEMSVRDLKRMRSDYEEASSIEASGTVQQISVSASVDSDSGTAIPVPDSGITDSDIVDLASAVPPEVFEKRDRKEDVQSSFVCLVKDVEELLSVKSVIQKMLDDISSNNKKKDVQIEVNIVF